MKRERSNWGASSPAAPAAAIKRSALPLEPIDSDIESPRNMIRLTISSQHDAAEIDKSCLNGYDMKNLMGKGAYGSGV